MQEVVGSTNMVLEINVDTKSSKTFQITPEERRMYIGGKGLGLYYLSTRLPANTDPLSPENVLILMMGPLLGTNAPCSGRFEAISKSPLTGIIVASSCGGPFGLALKTAGYEGLILHGKASTPVTIMITPEGVSFEDAAPLWGYDTHDTQSVYNLEKKDGALVIGPAGENLVAFANIVSGERFLGRAGLGAVMGSKNIKAIVARGGAYKIVMSDPKKYSALQKKAISRINANEFTGKTYRNFGTASNAKYCNEGGILPVNNFQVGQDDRSAAICGQTMREQFQYKASTCRPCSVQCGHKGKYPDGDRQIPEYETIGLMGSNLGIYDPIKISDWNEICGAMGMDTISAGGTLAYVMEASEKGLYQSPLHFGNPEGVSEALEDIAYRRGLGDEMANGSRWLSEKYGGKEFAIQIKGLEMAGYDPRGSWGQGLAYAVANRGACHLSATIFPLEVFFGFLNPYSTTAKAQFVRYFENLYCAVNSIQTCLFTGFAYILDAPIVKYTPKPLLSLAMQMLPDVAIQMMDISMFSNLLSLSTGVKYSPKEMLETGERIHLMERYMNVCEGISRKDDTLPERFLREGRLADKQNKVVPLDPLLDKYYALRGYTSTGIPTKETLQKHLIDPVKDYEKLYKGKEGNKLKPRSKWFKNLVVNVVFFVLGSALQSLSRMDETIKKEVASWQADTLALFKVLPKGPRMAFQKKPDGTLAYRGTKIGDDEATIIISFKNLECAFLMMTAQVGTAKAYAEHRMSVKGDLSVALSIIRCLNVVERYLFPTFIAKNVIKRLPHIPFYIRHIRRLWVYIAGVVFGL
ncbi:MAG: aldehyde ferredoxin oxidoreductase family protein [Anaerolineaceae bacterium]